MQLHGQVEYSDFSHSFSCYSSDSTTTSTAIAKIISEEDAARCHEIGGDIVGVDFEFSRVLSDEEVSSNETDSRGWIISHVFNRDHLLVINDGVIDRQIEPTNFEIEPSSTSIASSLGNLFVHEREEASSHSSSDSDELESLPSGSYCEWRPKADGASSPPPLITKCKKSSSTGSGSKKWRFRYLLRRSNNEGKKPMAVITPKKVNNPNKKRSSGDNLGIGGRRKAQTPVHEQFYLQRRAENEVGKRKSYLPYRKNLVGLFANVNGIGKIFPF